MVFDTGASTGTDAICCCGGSGEVNRQAVTLSNFDKHSLFLADGAKGFDQPVNQLCFPLFGFGVDSILPGRWDLLGQVDGGKKLSGGADVTEKCQ